ncbi:hypothetical protein L1987_52808 [Smallanthus sonchifolius]|uniref:Uncharacterized protein n=1 Tax=Smallanthus sonchifolius TaxID=185202 RepID=A0ACB9EU42_9ASTR|nr:hypothetical protein L1987_52808 [Smallanthus sonchifolius]
MGLTLKVNASFLDLDLVDTLKDYAIKALVNTVDHLGAVSFKVNNLIDEKVEDISGTELRVSCIEQRLRTCQGYFDHEGVSQQALLINIPKYHKRYILPVEEMMQGRTGTKLNHQECIVDDEHDWHGHKNGIDQATISEKLTTSVRRGRSPSPPRASQQPESFSFADTHPEPRRSVSKHRNDHPDTYKEADQIPSKSKRLLKALLSRRKTKKDETLYTYLDEY